MSTKLASHLFDSYLKYKKSEATLIEWIVNAAQISKPPSSNCAPKAGLQIPGANAVGGSRPVHPQDDATTGSRTTAIYDILPLVETIANSTKGTEIPLEMVVKFEEIIEMRSRCTKWFERNTTEDDKHGQRTNLNHRYPVQVLQHAVKVLRNKFPASYNNHAKARRTMLPTTDDNDYSNSFAALSVDDADGEEDHDILSQPPREHAAPVSEHRPAVPKLSRKAMMEQEYYFARFCLGQEVDAVTAMVLQEWLSYKLGNQTLIGAALLTNAAIDLVSRLEQEFERALIQQLDDKAMYEDLASVFFSQLTRSPSATLVDPMFRMHDIVFQFWSSSRPANQVVNRGGEALARDIDYFDTTFDIQADIELYLVALIFDDVRHYFKPGSEIQGTHGLLSRHIAWLHHFRATLRGPFDIPLAAAFAFRIEVLVSLICQDDVSRAKKTNLKMLDEVIQDSKDHLKVLTSKAIFFDNHRSSLRDEMVKITTSISEGAANIHRIHAQQSLKPYGYTISAHTLPVYAMKYNSMSTLAQATMSSKIVVAMAHLYNACKEEGYLTQSWPDLDFLLEQCGEAPFFQGSKPTAKNKVNYSERLAYSTWGLGKKAVSALIKGDTLSLPNSDIPSLRLLAMPLATVLWMRVHENDISNNSYTRHADLICRATTLQDILDRPSKAVHVNPDSTLANYDDLQKWAVKAPNLSASESLALTKRRLQRELPLLDFDFHAMNKACLLLVGQLAQLSTKNKWCFAIEPGRQYPAFYPATTFAADVLGNVRGSTIAVFNKARREEAGNAAVEKMKATSDVFAKVAQYQWWCRCQDCTRDGEQEASVLVEAISIEVSLEYGS